jgi:glycerol kinase
MQVAEVLAAVGEVAGQRLREVVVDGGAAANDLLLELQAALAGVTVRRPRNLETTAQGAFRMALAGARGPQALDALPAASDARAFAPSACVPDVAAAHRRWREAVSRCKRWASA